MFFNCESLKELDLSNCITNNDEDYNDMLNGCTALIKLNLGKLSIEKNNKYERNVR